MRIIGWNYRGIYKTSTVQALRAQIKGAKPNILFLCETKVSEDRMDKVLNSIGFSKKLVVDAKNTTGGLCLMWKSSVSVSLVDFNKDLIAVKVSDAIYNWIFVGFYRPSYASKKKKAWENLFVLLESIHIP